MYLPGGYSPILPPRQPAAPAAEPERASQPMAALPPGVPPVGIPPISAPVTHDTERTAVQGLGDGWSNLLGKPDERPAPISSGVPPWMGGNLGPTQPVVRSLGSGRWSWRDAAGS